MDVTYLRYVEEVVIDDVVAGYKPCKEQPPSTGNGRAKPRKEMGSWGLSKPIKPFDD